METPDWIAALPESLHRQLFPHGQADVADALERFADLEAAGYPMRCADPETLLQVAQIGRE